MKYDLRLRTKAGKDVLEVLVDRDPPKELCEWRDRNLVVQEWLGGRLTDPIVEDVLLNLPCILKESKSLSTLDQQYIADWIIDALLPHQLHARGENVLHETLQVLLFDVLIPLWPQEQKKLPYREELLYTLRRWFTLINDSRRSWFERPEHGGREQALQRALFSQGQMHSFYALPDFSQITDMFADWVLRHYDLSTYTKIPASLYQIRDERRSWWKKLWLPIALLFSRKHWWVPVLVAFLLVILTGLFLPFSGNTALSASTFVTVGSFFFLLLFLLLVPPGLRLPRMLGAIGVGYVVLLITADVWKIAFRMWQGHQSLAGIIFVSSLLASFAYLVAEMGSKVPSLYQRCLRSLLVLGIGLGQSLLVGIVSCSLVGAVFMGEVIEQQTNLLDFAKFQIHFHPCSLDLVLYPEVVLFLAPVALFVGIFSQILWEEKEITSPL